MFTETTKLPSDTRVWIYQANRELTTQEEQQISEQAKDFVEGWTAHNKELKAGFEIRHHLFLIFMIDEKQAMASGCSIDKSVHFIKKIEKDFSLSLTDRLVFAYKENGNIKLATNKEFEKLFSQNVITNDTLVFDNLIQTKSELDNKWQVPLDKSWHKRFVS